MSEEAKWYVVHTYSGYENKVATNIEKAVENRGMHELIQEVKVPTETVTEIKDNKKREVERKIFPGYVLIKMIMTDESWYIVRNTRGCTGFVGPSSKPIPLTEKEVAALGVEKRQIEVNYGVGDTIRITDGPMEGFAGIVKELDVEKDKVKVVVSMFGRETPVELELDQVEYRFCGGISPRLGVFRAFVRLMPVGGMGIHRSAMNHRNYGGANYGSKGCRLH